VKHKWNDKPIHSQDAIPELEREAALKEFGDGHSREEAERLAYKAYKDKHHTDGAAFHLRGLKAAQSAGDVDEAKKHGSAYAMHLSALGLDSMDEVPDTVKKLAESDGKPTVHKFKSHPADHFLLSPL